MYIADSDNDRIMVAGLGYNNSSFVIGPRFGSELKQLDRPADTIITNTSLYILDRRHHQVKKLSLNGSNLTTSLAYSGSYDCHDFYVDDEANIYLSDTDRHRILLFRSNSSNSNVVAGTGKPGSGKKHLNHPLGIFVDRNDTIYIADYKNHRVMKWFRGTSEGIPVAKGKITGSGTKNLNHPTYVIVDTNKYLYISEYGNDRITRWTPDSMSGACIAACTETAGTASHQLKEPRSLLFDSYGSLYVADRENHRVQKFQILSNPSKYFIY